MVMAVVGRWVGGSVGRWSMVEVVVVVVIVVVVVVEVVEVVEVVCENA